jgi:DNA-directed RNA polymerase subunit H (RpoH/RPB5)
MKTKKALFYLLAGILTGCVPSLHSLFTEKDIFFEPRLVGVWAGDNSSESWQFTRQSDSNSYEVIYTAGDEEEEKGSFTGTLGRIDEMVFLDLYPDDTDSKIQANEFYKVHLVPAHTFMKIEQIQPILKMRVMNPETLNEMLESDPNLLRHEKLERDRVVLTASTEELQQFMREHAGDEDLFDEPMELKYVEQAKPDLPDCNDV